MESQMLLSISHLPLEIQFKILNLAPQLRLTNAHFYSLYNQQFFNLLVSLFGAALVEKILLTCQSQIIDYVIGADVVRRHLRDPIAKYLKLREQRVLHVSDIHQTMYIADSWRVVYHLIRDRKFFFYKHHFDKITGLESSNGSVTIKKVQGVKYCQTVWLCSGKYNLSVALKLHNHSQMLGTLRFSFQIHNSFNGISVHERYPPIHIKDMIKQDVACLNLGGFQVPQGPEKLVRVDLCMDEPGWSFTSGITFLYFDLKPDLEVLSEKYLFWILMAPVLKWENIVNVLEKKVADCVSEVINTEVVEEAVRDEEEERDEDEEREKEEVKDHKDLIMKEEKEELVEQKYTTEELQQIMKKFSISNNDHELTRLIKFIDVVEARNYEKYREAAQFDKMRLPEGGFLLRWRIIWG